MIRSPAEALQVLELGPDADAEAIRRAYRRKARSAHPDAGGDVDEFQRLQAAATLLLEGTDTRLRRTASSPSTGSTRRPSTATTMAGADWGEASTRRWHDGSSDVTSVDWDRELPDTPHAWSRELVAIAAAQPMEQTVVHPVEGRSRKPDALLNRFVGAISSDLLATFRIAPASSRGVPGHDVEVQLTAPPGRARKRLDETPLPLGWVKERRPDSTVATLLVHPSRDRRATAVRVADHLAAAADAMEWPLEQWRRTS